MFFFSSFLCGRHSVGKHASILRQVKPSDFDPKEKFWTRFPPEGSKSTPPHQSVEFRWKDYCPMVFRYCLIPIASLNFAVHIGELCGLCIRIHKCLVVQCSSAMVVRILFIFLFFFWGLFRRLRDLFQIDPADYMLAICGNDALRELSSPGKSGSFFYLTQDDRFMIKTVKKSEVKVSCRPL